MPTHTRRGDETPITVVLQLLPENIHAALVLLSEYLTRGFGAVKHAVEIRRDDAFVMRELAVDHPTLRPRDPGVGDEDVQTPAQVVDAVVDDFASVGVVCDINLVGLAFCKWSVTCYVLNELEVGRDLHFTPYFSSISFALS